MFGFKQRVQKFQKIAKIKEINFFIFNTLGKIFLLSLKFMKTTLIDKK